PPTEGHDDVTELALIRTASRELEAAKHVTAHLRQIKPWDRHAGHVGPLGLLVPAGVAPVAPLPEKLRPGEFGLADEDHVSKIPKVILLYADPRAADDGEYAPAL